MLIETDAIVLSAIKFGDTSLIARCYCKKIGLKSFLLKGILSTKKGSLKKSLFQPLSMIRLITQVKNQSSEGLHYIKEARVNFSLIEIPTDIKKNAVTLFLSEILTRVITEEGTPNIHFYHFIEKNIKRLESKAFSPLFHLKFMMELSRHLGFYPNRSNISEGYFDLESGCFCSSSPSKHFIEGYLLMAFKKLLGTDFDTLDRCVIDNSLRIKVLNVLIDYFNLHLPNFGKIKSIDILHEIFR